MKKFKFLAGLAALGLLVAGLSACDETDSKVVNANLDTAAEQFEINRRIVAVNSITDEYLLTIEGRCDISYKDTPQRGIVTCKVADGDGQDAYKRHTVTLADNVTLVSEQVEAVNASAYHYRVIYKPQTMIPDVDFKGSTKDTPKTD